jgi:hypothetical protein
MRGAFLQRLTVEEIDGLYEVREALDSFIGWDWKPAVGCPRRTQYPIVALPHWPSAVGPRGPRAAPCQVARAMMRSDPFSGSRILDAA